MQQSIFPRASILACAEDLRNSYALRNVIRYGHDKLKTSRIESDPEHCHNMGVLADLFYQIEPAVRSVDLGRVHTLIRYHDYPETGKDGDVPQTKKGVYEKKTSKDQMVWLMDRTPRHLRQVVKGAIREFEDMKTLEARFALALDKFEPTMEVWLNGVDRLVGPNSRCIPDKAWHGWTPDARREYCKDFQVIYEFGEVLGSDIEGQIEEHCPAVAAE